MDSGPTGWRSADRLAESGPTRSSGAGSRPKSGPTGLGGVPHARGGWGRPLRVRLAQIPVGPGSVVSDGRGSRSDRHSNVSDDRRARPWRVEAPCIGCAGRCPQTAARCDVGRARAEPLPTSAGRRLIRLGSGSGGVRGPVGSLGPRSAPAARPGIGCDRILRQRRLQKTAATASAVANRARCAGRTRLGGLIGRFRAGRTGIGACGSSRCAVSGRAQAPSRRSMRPTRPRLSPTTRGAVISAMKATSPVSATQVPTAPQPRV